MGEPNFCCRLRCGLRALEESDLEPIIIVSRRVALVKIKIRDGCNRTIIQDHYQGFEKWNQPVGEPVESELCMIMEYFMRARGTSFAVHVHMSLEPVMLYK